MSINRPVRAKGDDLCDVDGFWLKEHQMPEAIACINLAPRLAEALRLLAFPSRGQCMEVDFEKELEEAKALLVEWDAV